MGPYQVLPLWLRVDLGANTMMGYSASPQTPSLLEPHYQVARHEGLLLGRFYSSAVSVFNS